ncbi:ABC transporter ATP-binding protein [Serinibacter arcticus]|uniref:ABC transporter, ATP-binding protein n=1 Tax=Serinibacter arcticus TaxID=1655435 RepID=A0A4Z1DYW3_9MICO|nr:ABC transporter ATP-binding protein [Serinibacter arcticus]TGO04129.1 ABC transporter, ATP-binding protein [Serinibacter arcticus]
MTAGPFVQCEDLVRIFSVDGLEVQALQGLNLRIDEGELVAIVGASGSGKSTLLTILSGLDRPTGGSARVAGLDLTTLTSRQRVTFQREIVGFVWQQASRNLLPYLTARENVALPRALAGRRGGRSNGGDARVSELIELLDLGDCADRWPAQLSGGQQQRTAIAVAIANAPRLLLADEPTGELDEAASVDVLRAMEAVNAELGVTVVIVTHDPEVSEHVDRTIQIRDGRTSREVLRRTETDEHGAQRRVIEEFAVLDRVGRMQLPESYLEALDLRDRVRLDLETDHVEVFRDVPQGKQEGER